MHTRMFLVFRMSSVSVSLARTVIDTTEPCALKKVLDEYVELARVHALTNPNLRGEYLVKDIGMNLDDRTHIAWRADIRHFIPGWRQSQVNGRKVSRFTSPEQLTLKGQS